MLHFIASPNPIEIDVYRVVEPASAHKSVLEGVIAYRYNGTIRKSHWVWECWPDTYIHPADNITLWAKIKQLNTLGAPI